MSQVLDILVDSGIQLSIQRKGIEMFSDLEAIVLDATQTIKDLQERNERLSRMLYEEQREHRNDREVANEYAARLEAEIAELRS